MKNTFRLSLIIGLMLLASCAEVIPKQVGEEYQGGLICYVDHTGQHGLICPIYDQNNGVGWSNGTNIITNATNNIMGQGQNNTSLIVSLQGTGNYAAYICDTLSLNGYTDWYLPTRDELTKIYESLKLVGLGNLANSLYWTSTENNLSSAWTKDFSSGSESVRNKTDGWHVRAIRSF